MCHRLHCGHDDEGREIKVGDIDLISMCLKIASNRCVTVSN